MISLVQPSRGHITQFFGARQVDGNPHAGQDYAYTNGREVFPEVYAAADGVVLFAGDSRGLSWPNIMYLNPDFDRSDNVDTSAGIYTIIAHHDSRGNRIALTGYGHQENVWVSTGQAVSRGQRIGTVGETGFSAGRHLHFDLVLTPFDVDDAPYYGRVDPNPYFVSGTTYNLNSSQLGTTTSPEEDELSAAAEQDISRIRQILEAAETDRWRERIIALDDRTAIANSKYLKGDQEPTLYELTGGKLRGISMDEWQASGLGYRTLPQDIINALPKEG